MGKKGLAYPLHASYGQNLLSAQAGGNKEALDLYPACLS